MLLRGHSFTVAARRACAIAAAVAIPLLAGCEAGLNAPVLPRCRPQTTEGEGRKLQLTV